MLSFFTFDFQAIGKRLTTAKELGKMTPHKLIPLIFNNELGILEQSGIPGYSANLGKTPSKVLVKTPPLGRVAYGELLYPSLITNQLLKRSNYHDNFTSTHRFRISFQRGN
jgi:hypothetical protein